MRRGWAALESAVAADGKLGWVQRVGAGPAQSFPDESFPYGVGLFLLAAGEVLPLAGELGP